MDAQTMDKQEHSGSLWVKKLQKFLLRKFFKKLQRKSNESPSQPFRIKVMKINFQTKSQASKRIDEKLLIKKKLEKKI